MREVAEWLTFFCLGRLASRFLCTLLELKNPGRPAPRRMGVEHEQQELGRAAANPAVFLALAQGALMQGRTAGRTARSVSATCETHEFQYVDQS